MYRQIEPVVLRQLQQYPLSSDPYWRTIHLKLKYLHCVALHYCIEKNFVIFDPSFGLY